jgi:crotonobetainyl-CoA:carnitine CoA-transferase CaiB-like acyl-CoA transferase
VPASAIRSIPEIVEHPQVAHRRAVDRVSSVAGVARDIQLVRSGFIADADGPEINSPPPGKGEHTNAILHEAGYSEQEIAMLREDGVL